MIKTTIVGIGDSLTVGYGTLTGSNYLDRLEKNLPKYYPSIYWSIHNVSKVGITTREGLHLLENQVFPLKPNIVFIMFGANDISLEPHLHRSQVEFENNLKLMIEKLLHLNNHSGLNHCIPIPILITPPCVIDEIVTPDRSNNRIHQYAHLIKLLGNTYHCPVIDFFDITMAAQNQEKLFQKDGVHLTKEGYDLLFDAIFQEFTKLINYEGLLKDREK